MRLPPPPPAEGDLRADVQRILRAALAAVDPARLVGEAIGPGGTHRPDLDALLAPPADRPPPRRLRVVAVGKAALEMARGAFASLPPSLELDGWILVPGDGEQQRPPGLPGGIRYREGGHPLPTAAGVRATTGILASLRAEGDRDPVLVLLSGGGSALLSHPAAGLELQHLRDTTDLLLRAGAPIQELNTVRRHLESAKGGGLARAAEPAPVLGLILSDVIGSDPGVIASGPLSPAPTTPDEALRVLERHGLLDQVPDPVVRHLRGCPAPQAPDGRGGYDHVRLRIIGDVGTALRGAEDAARAAGYHALLLTPRLRGEAREVGRALGALAGSIRRSPPDVRRPTCLLAGGETTVTVRGPGRGGRNQEIVVAAALELEDEEGVLVASLATDGVDGPTSAAGGLATGSTAPRARSAGLDLEHILDRNDTHTALEALGDLILTGPTGTNVMDLQVVLIR